jgi:hypothetical protein
MKKISENMYLKVRINPCLSVSEVETKISEIRDFSQISPAWF